MRVDLLLWCEGAAGVMTFAHGDVYDCLAHLS